MTPTEREVLRCSDAWATGLDGSTTELANAVRAWRMSGGTVEGWQPIATAPKEDGASVLLWNRCDVFEGYWEAARDFWAVSDGGYATPVPTHWMPLPPAPETNDE